MKPILFIDFDGTLCHDRFWRSIGSDTNKKIQTHLFGSDNKIVVEWMRGNYTSEEINLMLSKECDVDYKTLWSVFVRDCETMLVERDVLDKIRKLRERYIVVLATDNMDCFNRFTVPALSLGQYFDEVVNSYYEKISKNEDGGRLFKRVIEKNGLTIKDSILADNSRSTCELFAEIGGRSLLVTKEKDLNYWLDTLLI